MRWWPEKNCTSNQRHFNGLVMVVVTPAKGQSDIDKFNEQAEDFNSWLPFFGG
jgi:hypothetical protein